MTVFRDFEEMLVCEEYRAVCEAPSRCFGVDLNPSTGNITAIMGTGVSVLRTWVGDSLFWQPRPGRLEVANGQRRPLHDGPHTGLVVLSINLLHSGTEFCFRFDFGPSWFYVTSAFTAPLPFTRRAIESQPRTRPLSPIAFDLLSFMV